MTSSPIAAACDRPCDTADQPLWMRLMATAVLTHAIRIAALSAPTRWDYTDKPEDARNFLKGATPDDLTDLTFWCRVAGYPVDRVIAWAQAERWRQLPANWANVAAGTVNDVTLATYATGAEHIIDVGFPYLGTSVPKFLAALQSYCDRRGLTLHQATRGAEDPIETGRFYDPEKVFWVTPQTPQTPQASQE